jgi:hypothetical protein
MVKYIKAKHFPSRLNEQFSRKFFYMSLPKANFFSLKFLVYYIFHTSDICSV